MGLARTMSMGLVGRHIDIIPHTGVIVHGEEHFFSGGLQSLPPPHVAATFGLQPVERVPLGRTRRTREELRAFLARAAPRYTAEVRALAPRRPERRRKPAASPLAFPSRILPGHVSSRSPLFRQAYDLFRHNCNHFSDELVRFLLGEASGVPERIMTVPEQVRRRARARSCLVAPRKTHLARPHFLRAGAKHAHGRLAGVHVFWWHCRSRAGGRGRLCERRRRSRAL